MPHQDLPAIQSAFFDQFLQDLPGHPTLDQVRGQQPQGQPLVLHGDYVAYHGAAITALQGVQKTPQFAISAAEPGATSGQQTYVLLWLLERLDVATDSQQTMARILADFRAPAPPAAPGGGGATPPGGGGTSPPGGGGTTPPSGAGGGSLDTALAQRWATALATPAVRTALAKNLDQITAVPQGLPTSDLEELKAFLRYFGTYRDNGNYYAKGAVAEGRFPEGATNEYLNENVLELKLQRDHFYCSALVGERLWNPQAAEGSYRQLVYRVNDLGQDAPQRYRLALLLTVAAQAAANRFIFFRADEGIGVPIPQSSFSSVGPGTAGLLAQIPTDPAGMAAAINDPNLPIVGPPGAPVVLLLGRVNTPGPLGNLPPGVTESGEGLIRTFRCPPDQVQALMQRTDIQDLDISTPIYHCMIDADREIRLAARTFPAGITAANTGQGVVVGIVDVGMDGGHVAFLGNATDPTKTRIHSIWDMSASGGQSPQQRASAANAARYDGMTFGREYIGHAEVTGANVGGDHGTHVAGIAAGRPHPSLTTGAGPWPGGIAPAATIVGAAIGNRGAFVSDVVQGVRYCFQKATELGLPCVVNISLGTMRHSFDGTDPLSIALTGLVSANTSQPDPNSFLIGTMPQFVGGRIICAAAGNNRADNLHWQSSIEPGSTTSLLYRHTVGSDGVTFWAHCEDGSTVRLEVQARHSTNAVLATPTVGPRANHAPLSTSLLGGNLRVNIHNGPARPNNGHCNPEIYWFDNTGGAASGGAWVVTLRNVGRSPVMAHAFAAYREFAGSFVVNPAQTQPTIGISYSPEQLARFNAFKVGIPGAAVGTICVAAFTSRAVAPEVLGNLAFFSSPGPLRAVVGRRAVDCTAPGHRITSAKAGGGLVDMSGTSMATPVVTGLVAGLLQQNPNLNTSDIRARLEAACTRRPGNPATGQVEDKVDDWGLGRIDASLFRA